MLFKLGAVLVKGGKVISTGYNHHRTHYDGNDVKRKPVSMHAEMHTIFNACVSGLPLSHSDIDSSDAHRHPALSMHFILVCLDSRLMPSLRVRPLRSASNLFKGIPAVKIKEPNGVRKAINAELSRFTWPSLVLKRAQAKETQRQGKRFRPQRLQHCQSNRNRNRKGGQDRVRQERERSAIDYQHQFSPNERAVGALSRRCNVLNRAKDSRAKKAPSKPSSVRHHAQVPVAGSSGNRGGSSGCYVISGGQGQTTLGPAALASPHPRRARTRINGADIYVVRTTKKGLGNAKPCWRCLEWCRWAGVRRIFYWDATANDDGDDDELSSGDCSSDSASVDSTDTWEKPKGRWEVVKVNSCRVEDCYITSTDGRILCGEVSIICLALTKCIVNLARLIAPFAGLTRLFP